MPIAKKKVPPALLISREAPEENVVLAWTRHETPFAEVRALDPEIHRACLSSDPTRAVANRVIELAIAQGFTHVAVLLPFEREDRLIRLAFKLRQEGSRQGVTCSVHEQAAFPPPLAAGPRLRFIRQSLGMKTEEFAAWTGRTRQMVDRWERQKDRMDRFSLWGIAGATKANYFWLLEGRGEPFGHDPRSNPRRA